MSADGLTIWNVADGSATTSQPTAGNPDCNDTSAPNLAVDAAATTVVIGAAGGCLVLWDVDAQSARPLAGQHTRAVTGVAISADGRSVVSGDETGKVVLWDVAAEAPRARFIADHGGAVNVVAFSAGGSAVTSVGRDGRILRYDVAAQRPEPVAQPQACRRDVLRHLQRRRGRAGNGRQRRRHPPVERRLRRNSGTG